MPKVDYYEYMASREWRVKRKSYIEEATYGVCERCAARPIDHVHHLTYARLGDENYADLMGVCRPCHEYLTAERDDDPALEVIQGVINKYGLRPDRICWPKVAEAHDFICEGEDSEFPLMMRVLPVQEGRDTYKALPKQLITTDIMAVFGWDFSDVEG